MERAADVFETTPEGFVLRDVVVRLARPDEVCRWNRVVDRHHDLGFKQFAGRGLRYVFTWRGRWMGAAGWQTGTFRCAPRDRWIGWRHEEQFERLHLIGNNTRFVILGGNYSPLVGVWLAVVLVEDVCGLSVEGDVDGDERVVAECLHGGEEA